MERFESYALGRPYHAALVDMRGRSGRHGHRDYYEVMAVTDGEGEQDLGSWRQPLRPGDVILMRPRDQHAITGRVRFYNIAFPATDWRTFAGLLGMDWDAAAQPPYCRVEDEQALDACATALRRFHESPTALDLIRFWTDIVPLFSGPTGDSPTLGPPDWLVAACAAMHREEHLAVGVPRLVALANVSPAHLSRSMRRHYGTTPTAFVADLRLRHAATLLGTTTRPVTDIAYACGFASPSYFTRSFRLAHGTSPREFRQLAWERVVPTG
jgi:AraC-like DNA-binding protein